MLVIWAIQYASPRSGASTATIVTVPAPADWRVELIGVPEAAEVQLRLPRSQP